MTLVLLHTLPAGASFRLPFSGRLATLHFANECRALISYNGPAVTRTVVAHKGEPDEKTFEVPDRSGPINITPNVLVEAL